MARNELVTEQIGDRIVGSTDDMARIRFHLVATALVCAGHTAMVLLVVNSNGARGVARMRLEGAPSGRELLPTGRVRDVFDLGFFFRSDVVRRLAGHFGAGQNTLQAGAGVAVISASVGARPGVRDPFAARELARNLVNSFRVAFASLLHPDGIVDDLVGRGDPVAHTCGRPCVVAGHG